MVCLAKPWSSYCYVQPLAHPPGKPVLMLSAQAAQAHNIHIKHFKKIPLADLEMVMPEKHIYVPPSVLLQVGGCWPVGLCTHVVGHGSRVCRGDAECAVVSCSVLCCGTCHEVPSCEHTSVMDGWIACPLLTKGSGRSRHPGGR